MDRRQTIMDAVEARLKAANTLAKDRVYQDRTTDIESERSNNKPPLICIYMAEMQFARDAGASQFWTETSSFTLECWAEVSPERASKYIGGADKAQSAAMNALAQQAVNALIGDAEFINTYFSEAPNVIPKFAQDKKSQFTVACATIEFRYILKGTTPYTNTPDYADLEEIWVDYEVKGSPGSPPPAPEGGLSAHPDVSQLIPDLQE